MLEWLGDVGGLFDGLIIIFSYLVTPIAAFTMKAELLFHAFSVISKDNQPLKHSKKFVKLDETDVST